MYRDAAVGQRVAKSAFSATQGLNREHGRYCYALEGAGDIVDNSISAGARSIGPAVSCPRDRTGTSRGAGVLI